MIDALLAASHSDATLFCTPGHRRGRSIPASMERLMGSQAYSADLPDLPGFNLFESEGFIASAQIRAAQLFGADRTWFLANGSTVGVMAAILATCGPGDKIILPRNVHTSAISGLILSGAHPIFINPEYDPDWDLVHCITPYTVARALDRHPDAKAIFMVSPTYHGVCGDVGAIAHLAHQQNIPLIVDEAHGAHFGFHADLPAAALTSGADFAVQSTHKTLSALTQASLLHQKSSLVDPRRVGSALQILQSSSPSNLLLASLEGACQQMSADGPALMSQTLAIARTARAGIGKIAGLSILQKPEAPTAGFFDLDPTRLTVDVSALGLDGFRADEICTEQFGIVAELPTLRHLTFIVSLGNRSEDIDRLFYALRHLPQQSTLATHKVSRLAGWPPTTHICHPARSPREAFFAPRVSVPIDRAPERVSAETLCPYPPGIPVILPGEAIAPEAIAFLQQIQAAGGLIAGCADPTLQSIQVIQD
ncbi:aminotransferase class I/II-fold pyridoxal phosphate-dependent enzyme [Altericista sp. CCNU0014]|uniref:aminotransferase class I/II-fold pyridoxal phosphate-dependent enzyme n=1 Tax=Altericista sp. CCNU0014 TaxID=3082949 RepID=UPI00384BD2FA